MTNTTMIYLLISGGAVVVIGMALGVAILRYGISIGNRLTFSSINNIPLDEEIISINQENTE